MKTKIRGKKFNVLFFLKIRLRRHRSYNDPCSVSQAEPVTWDTHGEVGPGLGRLGSPTLTPACHVWVSDRYFPSRLRSLFLHLYKSTRQDVKRDMMHRDSTLDKIDETRRERVQS